MAKTRMLTTTALLIALEIILRRFLSIQTPILQISLAFIPIVLIAMLYGSISAAIAAAVADFLGVLLFPVGAFFPGFTLTAFLVGAVYGLFLYKKPQSLWKICAATLIINFILQLGLNTLWIQMITGTDFLALIPARVMRPLIMAPVQIVCIQFMVKVLLPRVEHTAGATNG